MKKNFLLYLIALLPLFVPIFALAQGQWDVLNDVAKKTLGIASSFRFNDQLGVYQVNLNDSTFELIALNNKMEILWRNQFKGNGVACGKFKDNLLAIADSGYSRRTEFVNPYYAYLIDPLSGKTILQKEIFKQQAKHQEIAYPFFTGDGSDFSLIVRQTNRKLGMLLSFKDKTEDVTIIKLDEKLAPTYLKPKFPNETFVSLTGNQQGDLFVLTAKDDIISAAPSEGHGTGEPLDKGYVTLVARRYEYGAIEPSEPISQKCESLGDFDLFRGYNAITPSENDRNILFLAIAHNNSDDDRELFIGKFDFAAHIAKSSNEVFTGKYVRGIEKSFIPVNDYYQKANIGGQKKQLTVRYFREHNGKLVTVMAESFFATMYNVTTYYEKAFIINCYDNDLKKQFQQLMPVYRASSEELTTGFAFEENALKIVSNTDDYPIYGQLDLLTGKWLKLEPLKTEDTYSSDKHVIWFDNSFIVPSMRHPGIFGNKYNINLLRYTY